MRALPARPDQTRELASPDPPVRPGERDPTDEKDKEGAGKQVFHVAKILASP